MPRWTTRGRRATAVAVMLGALCALPGSAQAGAWNRDPGGYYFKLAYGHQRATRLATPDGRVVDIPTFTKDQLSVYAEYGLHRRWTLIVDGIAYHRSEIDAFDSASGIGDLRAGLQFQLGTSGPWVWSARALAQAPLGDETKGESLLPTGSGVWEGEFVLAVGRSLGKDGRGWAQAEVGHRARSGGLRDALVYAAQLGVRLGGRVLVSANARGLQPWDASPGDASTRSAAGFGDGVTYLTWGPGASLELGAHAAIEADIDFPTHTRNIAHGPTWRIGVSVRR